MSDLNKPVILVKFSFDMHVMYEEMYRDDFEDLLHEFISEVPEIELEEWRDAFYD